MAGRNDIHAAMKRSLVLASMAGGLMLLTVVALVLLPPEFRIIPALLLAAELTSVAVMLVRCGRHIEHLTSQVALHRDELVRDGLRAAGQNAELLRMNGALNDQAVVLEQQKWMLESTLEELRLGEERLRTLVSSMTDMVYTIDSEGRYDALIGQWVEREKLDPAVIIGLTPVQILGHTHGNVHRDANERALRGESVVYDWTTTKSPEQRWFTTAISPLRDVSGSVVGAVGVTRDIS